MRAVLLIDALAWLQLWARRRGVHLKVATIDQAVDARGGRGEPAVAETSAGVGCTLAVANRLS